MTEEQMAHNRRRALEIAAEYDGESGVAIRVDHAYQWFMSWPTMGVERMVA